LMPLLLDCGKRGGIEKLLTAKSSLRHGVYTYRGCVTNRHLSERFKMKYTNMDLLLAATM